MTEFSIGLLSAAFLTGLAGGSGHCIGMCGGIVGALGLRNSQGWRGMLQVLNAHCGRMLGYAVIGAIVGAIGATAASFGLGSSGITVLRIVSAILIGLIGLQLLLGRPLLVFLERYGAKIWRYLAPMFRSLLPLRSPSHALAAGVLWGWLPCGLVYAQLSVAATAGSAATGALVMISFGLGTSLSLSMMSVLLQAAGLARLPRLASGVMLLLFAAWTAMPVISRTQHMMH